MRNLHKKIARDLPHFVALFGVLGAGLVGILVFSYDKPFQTGIVFAMAFSYFVWGVVHHYIHHDLNFGIMLEYLSISIISLVTVLSVI